MYNLRKISTINQQKTRACSTLLAARSNRNIAGNGEPLGKPVTLSTYNGRLQYQRRPAHVMAPRVRRAASCVPGDEPKTLRLPWHFRVLNNFSHPLSHPRSQNVAAPAAVQEIGDRLEMSFEAGQFCPACPPLQVVPPRVQAAAAFVRMKAICGSLNAISAATPHGAAPERDGRVNSAAWSFTKSAMLVGVSPVSLK